MESESDSDDGEDWEREKHTDNLNKIVELWRTFCYNITIQ